jgi:hypothetical protein
MLTGLAFAAVLIAGTSAQALVSFDVVSDGAQTVTVAPGATVNVQVFITTSGAASGYGVSVAYDGGTASGAAAVNPPGTFPGFAPTCAAGVCGSFNALAFPALAAGTHLIGTFSIQTGATTINLLTGFLTAGQDAVAGDANVVFNGGTINVPEPSTAALMLMGLAGLARVGRRS